MLNRRPRTQRLTAASGVVVAVGLSVAVAQPAATASTAGVMPRAEAPVIFVNPKAGADRLPRIPASSWILVDADSGDILAAKDPHHQYPPASTLKVLTAVTLMPHLQQDSLYTANYQDVNQPGTRIGLRAGMANKVSDLFAGMMMNSGNDAASAVANAAGGWESSLRLMNEEAARLGAKDTVAATPNGLDRTEQLSSAADLAIFFREALKMPELAEILKTKTRDAQTVNGRLIHLYNHNKMLQLNYPGHLGAKTGTTSMAGKTVVSAFKRGHRTLIVALMRYGSTMERASKPLYDWGFANASRVTPVGHLPVAEPRPPVEARPAVRIDDTEQAPAGEGTEAAVVSSQSGGTGGSLKAIGFLALIGLGGAAIFGFVRWRNNSSSGG